MNTDDNTAPVARQMKSITFKDLLINFTTDFSRSSAPNVAASQPRAFWRPNPHAGLLPGFFPVGDIVASGNEHVIGKRVAAVVCEDVAQSTDPSGKKALAQPLDYERLWADPGPGAIGSLWRPLPPKGYVAMGLVCSSDNEKPSFHAVRCVRADLVIASNAGVTLWDNWDSGDKPPFVAWDIKPPVAPPGEIYFAAGTFVGYNNNAVPSTYTGTYSLRMQIPLKINPGPEIPVLTGFEAQSPAVPKEATQTATLPWFVVEDNALLAIDSFSKSPYYRFTRTDRYVLIGNGRNADNKSKLFRWTTPQALLPYALKMFTGITNIEVKHEWPEEAGDTRNPLRFSAHLSKFFTRTETSVREWLKPRQIEIASFVPKNKMLAVYQLQSHYRLQRDDGSEVAINFAYADNDSLHFAEYPPEESEAIVPAAPVIESRPVTDSAP